MDASLLGAAGENLSVPAPPREPNILGRVPCCFCASALKCMLYVCRCHHPVLRRTVPVPAYGNVPPGHHQYPRLPVGGRLRGCVTAYRMSCLTHALPYRPAHTRLPAAATHRGTRTWVWCNADSAQWCSAASVLFAALQPKPPSNVQLGQPCMRNVARLSLPLPLSCSPPDHHPGDRGHKIMADLVVVSRLVP